MFVSASSQVGCAADQINREIRTISYLLYPPLLDEGGLESALRWHVETFAERSRIKVNLDVAAHLGRFAHDVEISLFRVVQEALTNIHLHSGSSTATIHLDCDQQHIRLEIADEGRGIVPEKQRALAGVNPEGVGIRGMRERLWQFGGTLEIRSSDSGTLLKVAIPLERAQAGSGQGGMMEAS
jgi:signal transduction histidine kinase